MATIQGRMIPEKYEKTRFTVSCWFYLSKNPQLTFQEYQKVAKDRICRESVFDQVKSDMQLDRMFNRPEAVHPPEPSEAPPRQHPPQPPPPPNPAMKEALTAGLARSGAQSARGPISLERRLLAEDWIRGHLDAGYAQFKEHHTEPELDKAWFDKVRKKALEPAPPATQETYSMPTMTKKKEGRTKTGDAQRVREFLQKLPREKLKDMAGKEYSVASGHKPKSPAIFYAVKKELLQGKLSKAKGGPKASGRSVQAPAVGSLWNTIAELPVVDFKCAAKDLREIALALVKVLHPRGAEAKVVILSDPHVMEIRVPYQ